MRLVADGVFLLGGFPPHAVNVYLVDDVLVDAGTPLAARRILRQLEGRRVATHVLTHAHPDHAGSSAAVCRRLGVPLWCGAADVEAAETGKPPLGAHQPRLAERLPGVPPAKVDRALHEGDEVAGFTVLDAPGHSPGHLAYWRESDRTLILGDVLFNLPNLRQPPKLLTHDPALNCRSIRKLAALEPRTVLFGHGPPLTDARRLAELAAGLPA